MELKKMTAPGFSCACCGDPIPVGGEFACCADCGSIFCKECVEDGSFEGHSCADYEEDWV